MQVMSAAFTPRMYSLALIIPASNGVVIEARLLRNADTSVQARDGRRSPFWRYADASGGHRIDASLRLAVIVYDAAQPPTMRMEEDGSKAHRMQVAVAFLKGMVTCK